MAEGAPSIRLSLSRWFAIQTLVGLSIACAAIYATTRWSFQVKQAEEFARYHDLVRHVVEDNRLPPNVESLRHKMGDFFNNHENVALELRAGQEALYVSAKALSARSVERRAFVLSDLPFRAQVVTLHIELDVVDDDRLLTRLAWTLFAVAAVGTAIVALTGFFLVRRSLKPLVVLAEQTAAVDPRAPGQRIAIDDFAEEIRPWIHQFNGLLSRVEDAHGQLTAFNADVAHELRTPLANMRAQIEVELAQTRSVESMRDALASQLEEAQRLSAIVADMLFLSKADRGAVVLRSNPVWIAEHAHAVTEFHEGELEARDLSVRIVGDALYAMDASLFRRGLSNLVGNAIRFGTAGTTIQIIITRSGRAVRVTVQNEGSIIEPTELPYIFERFYRVDRSRSDSSSHHGLGLAIVAAIARMHGGSTFAESSSGLTRIGMLMSDGDDSLQGSRESL